MTSSELVQYLQLLVYLSGVFAYGFIARQLLRDPMVLFGSWAVRGLTCSITLWYASQLIVEVLRVLAPGWVWCSWAAASVGGAAWLGLFPLMAHTPWQLIALTNGQRRPSSGLVVALAYVTALLLLPWSYQWITRAPDSVALALAGGPVVIYVAVAVVVACAGMLRLRRIIHDKQGRRLLSWLLATAPGVGMLVVVSLLVDESLQGQIVRAASQLLGVAPALVTLYFVQRYVVLRLTLPLRTLRHFLVAVSFVVMVMAAGPWLGIETSEAYRRLVAWAVLLSFVGGAGYSTATGLAIRRSTAVRRLLEPSIPPQVLQELATRLRRLRLPEQQLRELVAARLSEWLGTTVRFVERPGELDVPAIRQLWRHFERPQAAGCYRIGAPAALDQLLAEVGLLAAYPVRVDGGLTAVVVVEQGMAGVREGEREALELVLGQLADVLELRRLVEERVAAEQRVAEQERLSMLGLVAASLAHEVKNPLSSMKALAQTLEEELALHDPASDQVQDLRVIVTQINQLQEVTGEILGFARPRGDEQTNLAQLVRSTVYVVRAEARRQGKTIAPELAEETPLVAGSPAGWQMVVFNLVLNAVRHSPDGSTITVRLRDGDGGVIVLETENPGAAMAPERAAALFEPFVSDAGTGLGLAIVARRLSRLGGTIELENQPGRVVFRVRAPVAQE